MLKKTITYTDPFTEQQKTENFYFHLSKADIIDMEMSRKGGLKEHIERITTAEDAPEVMKVFKDVIGMSYGIRTPEGAFKKSPELRDAFFASEAYSELIMEMLTDPNAASDFINGVTPKGIDQTIATKVQGASVAPAETPALEKASVALGTDGHPSDTAAQAPPTAETTPVRDISTATKENPIVLTQEEIVQLDSDDLKAGLATGRYKLS